eukprot:3752279-Karenia_brevis.AAC.1
MWKDVYFECTKWAYKCPVELIAKYRRATGQPIRPPGFKGMMPPMQTVLEAEDEDKESNRMQEDDADEGGAKSAEGDGKPKWKKGKKGKWEKTQSWDEDTEKGMSSWEGHSSMASPEEYEAESQKRK